MSTISCQVVPAAFSVKIAKQSVVDSRASNDLLAGVGDKKSMKCPSSCATRKR